MKFFLIISFLGFSLSAFSEVKICTWSRSEGIFSGSRIDGFKAIVSRSELTIREARGKNIPSGTFAVSRGGDFIGKDKKQYLNFKVIHEGDPGEKQGCTKVEVEKALVSENGVGDIKILCSDSESLHGESVFNCKDEE